MHNLLNAEERNAKSKKYISRKDIKISKLAKSNSGDGFMAQRYINQIKESNKKLTLLKTLRDIDFNKPKAASEQALYSPQPRIHDHSKHFKWSLWDYWSSL